MQEHDRILILNGPRQIHQMLLSSEKCVNHVHETRWMSPVWIWASIYIYIFYTLYQMYICIMLHRWKNIEFDWRQTNLRVINSCSYLKEISKYEKRREVLLNHSYTRFKKKICSYEWFLHEAQCVLWAIYQLWTSLVNPTEFNEWPKHLTTEQLPYSMNQFFNNWDTFWFWSLIFWE